MPLLEIEGLRKSFRAPDGSVLRVLDIPSFSQGEGEHRALYGPSGCGKTTFLHVIAGILRPDAGSVRIDGRDMAALPESARDRLRAERLGYVFQRFHLLGAYTALENVLLAMRFGAGVDRDRARSLLERVGLGDRLRYRPRQLSVGQQQRVAVARALANRPRLVLADEPTGNLDPRSAAAALDLLQEVCRESGAALLVVSHDRDVLLRFPGASDLASLGAPVRASGGTP